MADITRFAARIAIVSRPYKVTKLIGNGKALAHGYHKLQHWNQWVSQHYLGCNLLHTEYQAFKHILNKHFGKHALLIGAPHQHELLGATQLPCHALATPLSHRDKQIPTIESDLYELPILTGCIDLVMLPHTLELIDNPRQLLAEACRIIKPEGLIAICGFNPYSAWGAKKFFIKKSHQPWENSFIDSRKIKAWLQLADFELEQQKHILFRPPTEHRGLYEKLKFIENIGPKLISGIGGVYILAARAKVVPLTPIKMKWKQELGNIGITPGVASQMRILSQ